MKTGVIIGRFQTPFLHEAHIALIKHVISKSDQVIILLGLAAIKGSSRNPLDYQTRAEMIREMFPQVTIAYIKDCRSDEVWSKNLDKIIRDLAKGDVKLYGSRDSFIPFYKGKYPVTELDSDTHISATVLREKARSNVINSPDFRAGVVYGIADKFPTVYTTVDIAILNEDGSRVLLGRKKGEKGFRFIGGFASPDSTSFEADARREVSEEVGIEITDPKYVKSYLINDWRYSKEDCKIKTIFFVAKYQSGRVEAQDDIDEASWFDIDKLTRDDIVEEHTPLLETLKSL